jgi:preprotein translocase subunit SecF
MAVFTVPEVDYTRYSNRQLAAVPIFILFISLSVIGGWYLMTGSPVIQGIAFTGGTEIQIAATGPQNAVETEIRQAFDAEPESIRSVPAQDVYIVTFQSDVGSVDAATLESQAEAAGLTVRSISSVSASFGTSTQALALGGLAVAFVGMSLLVFAMFRVFVPSIAVVISAFSDIMIAVAFMNIFGIELSLGTVAALLMIIGYSVDSDILLNNHILRRSGEFYSSTYRAMRTGITMTLTSIIAMSVMAVVATLFGIQLLASIGTVLVFGLLADLMNTYLLNLSLLRWYKFEGVSR